MKAARPEAVSPVPRHLVRRSRWRVAVAGAVAVTVLLSVLSAAAYVIARRAIYLQLEERLELAAHRDADDDVRPYLADDLFHAAPGAARAVIPGQAFCGGAAVARL